MRFEVAVATFLAAESSSLVTTARGEVQESAKLRKEAIKAISKKYNNYNIESRRLLLQQQQGRNNGRIWKAQNDRFQELFRKLQPSSITTRRQLENSNHAPDDPRSSSDSDSDSKIPDLGILPSGPTNDEEEQERKSSAKQRIQDGKTEKRTILKNRLGKTLLNAKSQRQKGFASSDLGNLHPDLGIISSARTKQQQQQQQQQQRTTTPLHSIHSAVQKFRRHLQNTGGGGGSYPIPSLGDGGYDVLMGIIGDDFGQNMLSSPISSIGYAYCQLSSNYEQFSGTPSCTYCELTQIYDEDGSQTGAYDLEMECPNLINNQYFGEGLLEFCTLEVCDTCVVDTENYLVNMLDCDASYFGDVMDDAFGGFEDAFSKPIAFVGNTYCEMNQYLAEETCTTCELTYTYDKDGLQTAPYSLEMDCPEAPKDYNTEEALRSLEELCGLNVCESCSVDRENFQVNMQNCDMSEIGNVLDDVFGNLEDAFTKPIAFTGSTYCEVNKLFPEQICTTCELTYTNDKDGSTYIYDENGSKTGPYSLEMDCPNAPIDDSNRDLLISLNDFCSMNACETCNVDIENFQVDMQTCDFSNSGYSLDSIFDDIGGYFQNITDNITYSLINDPGFYQNITDYIGVPNKTLEEYQVEGVAFVFDYYFNSLCEAGGLATDTASCAACGQKSSNGTTFSFEINCPSKFSASENGFGSYMLFAEAFCACPASVNVQCSTCEVNFWDSTINIQDCVAIGFESSEIDSCNIDLEYNVEFDQATMVASYNRFCSPPEVNYLQESIGRPDCDCTFDEATQTASFSCTYESKCQNITSYCSEGVRFCYSDRIDMTVERYGASTLRRCVNVSSPYDFSYCAGFSIPADDASSDATDSSSPPTCEMEVDGVICNSCSLVDNEDRYYSLGFINYVDAIYDCSNTVIGTSGTGNLTAYKILDDTLSYFIYKSLPCRGGCDLCGVEGDGAVQKSEFMTVRDGKFASEFWKNGTEETCFDAQLDAMMNRQLLNTEECQAVRDSAREPCGCKNPNLILSPGSDASNNDSKTSNTTSPSKESSGASSFGNKLTTSGAVMLTMVAASIINMLLG